VTSHPVELTAYSGGTNTNLLVPDTRQFMFSTESVCTTDTVPPLLYHIIWQNTKFNGY